jgi:hypothetical protein
VTFVESPRRKLWVRFNLSLHHQGQAALCIQITHITPTWVSAVKIACSRDSIFKKDKLLRNTARSGRVKLMPPDKLETPWTRARKKRHIAQEEGIGKLPGGVKTPGSGRIWRFKRDNRLWHFLIEARTTTKPSYTVSKEEFLKIEREGRQTPPGFLPGMQVDIQNLQLIVIRLEHFQELNQQNMELRAEHDYHQETKD